MDDVHFGYANHAGEDNRNVARMSSLLAGLPSRRRVPRSIDSVLQARTIRCNEAQLVIAGGVESMTRAPFVMGQADGVFSRSAKLEDTTIG